MAKEFTQTQGLILTILSDGMPHRRHELLKCLPDEMGDMGNLNDHICNIRRVLRPKGEDIVCQLIRKGLFYRHVRLLPNANNGKR